MYGPEVDDYVIWNQGEYGKHQGWVYFKGEPEPKKKGFPKVEHYITIELGVQNKSKEECQKSLHKKNHVLLLCYHYHWHELEYVKNRREDMNVAMYHSQEGRYADPQ